uniref:Uncharacterized protein n=1 Tax=Amphimedon queenslandica TaxID=400682 RepID=A0A1X7U415_AMPQE
MYYIIYLLWHGVNSLRNHLLERHRVIERLWLVTSIRGVWQSQSTSIMDVRVVDSDALMLENYHNHVLKTAERDKLKYQEGSYSIHSSFTSLFMTVNGLLGLESNSFLKRSADRQFIK